MAKAADVLNHLIPTGGWTIEGEDFASIVYDEGVTPITKKQFTDTFAVVDSLNATKAEEAAAKKAAILERLNITEEEARILLG